MNSYLAGLLWAFGRYWQREKIHRDKHMRWNNIWGQFKNGKETLRPSP